MTQTQTIIVWFILLLVGGWYLFIPWWAYLHNRILARPTVELLDWENYPLPIAFRERLEKDGQELQACGFAPSFAYLANTSKGNYESVSFLFAKPGTGITVSVIASLVGGPNGFTLTEMFTVLASRYEANDLPVLQTGNQYVIVPIGRRAQDLAVSFPHVTRIDRLLELHEKLEQRHFSHFARKIDDSEKTPEELKTYVETLYREIIQSWIDTGIVERVADEPDYRFPVSKIYMFCWGKWLPVGPILKWLRYQQSRRLECDLLRAESSECGVR